MKAVRLVMKGKYLGYIQKNNSFIKTPKSFKSLESQSFTHEPSFPITLEKRDVKLFTHRSRHVASSAERVISIFNIK